MEETCNQYQVNCYDNDEELSSCYHVGPLAMTLPCLLSVGLYVCVIVSILYIFIDRIHECSVVQE